MVGIGLTDGLRVDGTDDVGMDAPVGADTLIRLPGAAG